MINKRILPILFIAVLLVSLSACAKDDDAVIVDGKQVSTDHEQVAETKEISATLAVDNGQETKQYQGKIEAGKSVFDFTQKLCGENGLDFQFQDSEYGAFVEKIGEQKNDNASSKYWTFKVNGENVNVGAGAKVLNEGDKVEWRYGGME